MQSILLVSVLAALVSAPQETGSTTAEDAADVIQTAVWVSIDTPLLVDVKSRVEFTFDSPTGGRARKLDGRVEQQFIDVCTVLGDEREESSRTFLKVEAELDGKAEDPPFAGLVASFVVDTEGSKLSLQPDRGLPDPLLQDLLRASPCMWIWAPFPEQMALGDSFELNLFSLAGLLIGYDVLIESASAQLTLVDHDADKGRATFRGPATIAGPYALTHRGNIAVQGKLEIVIAQVEGRIASVELVADTTLTGETPTPILANGTLRTVVETRIPGDVERLLRRKPKFRSSLRRALRAGVTIELPSYWAEQDALAEELILIQTVDRNRGVAEIFIERVGAAETSFLEGIEAQLRQMDPKLKSKKVSSPLGKGRSFRFKITGKGRTQGVCLDVYERDGQWFTVRVRADEDIFKDSLADFEKARRTLRIARD